MKTSWYLILLTGLAPPVASAQLSSRIDARGVIQEVRVGSEVFLTDLAVSVEKPGWTGRLTDQRDVEPAVVHVRHDGSSVVYAMPLEGEDFTGRLILRVVERDDELVLDGEVFPDDDVEIEAVVLEGRLPADRHAGKTAYIVDGGAPTLLPAEPAADAAPLWSGGESRRLDLKSGSGTLRLAPRDAELHLLDPRGRGEPAFALRATAGGGEHLARKPIHLGLTLRVDE